MGRTVKCPLCQHMTQWDENPWRPFCSERCQLIDLGKWAGGEYRIAGNRLTADLDEDEPETDSPL